MATQDNVIILDVETGQSVKNVAELQAVIAGYKEQLKDTNATAEENAKTAGDLAKAQGALRDVMNASTLSVEDATKAIDLNNKSYNDMVHTMADLTKAWRATTDETARAKIGENIKQVNDKLKELDATKGTFVRNVGNYSSALDGLEKGMSAMGGSASSVINPIKGVTAGFKALSTTPVIAIIGLLVNLLSKVIGTLKTSEENTNAMTSALSVFAGVGDIVKNVMQALGKVLAGVADTIAKLAYKLFPALQKAADLRAEATKREIELSKRQREVMMQNADAEREIAELRAKVADKATYSAKERLAFLEKAVELEKGISERNYEIAKKEYELQQEQAKMAGNSREENDKLAQAYVKMVQAETAYFNKTKELNGQMSEAKKAIADANLKIAQAEEKAFKSVEDAIWADVNALDAELEKETQNAGKIIEETDKVAKARQDAELRRLDETAQRTKEYNALTIDDEKIRAEQERQITAKLLQDKLALLTQYSQDRYNAGDVEGYLAYQQQIADTELEIEKNKLAEEQRLRKEDAEKAKAMQDAKIAALQMAVKATSSLMNSLADIYEANGENDEESAKKAKALRIAGATIDTISGAIGAYMQGVKSAPSPFGQIIGAVQAAVVTATGMANIAKIRNTDVSGNSATSSGATITATQSAPQIQTAPLQVSNTASEQVLNQIANQPQRVYILQSDIEASNKASKVQVEESTFV